MSNKSILRVLSKFPATFKVRTMSASTLFLGSSGRLGFSRRFSTYDRQIINTNTSKPKAETMEKTVNKGMRLSCLIISVVKEIYT